jgi:ABC-type polysaccharide/polyol phosphate transport system ATPase subunit
MTFSENSPQLEVTNLGKQYAKHPTQRLKHSVLKDVSFSLAKGEILGIIGANACGKSTLLKIISGVLAPDAGQVTYKGKLTSMLELGYGFHPDLSGRENIRFSAEMMGADKGFTEKHLEEIVAFSGIGDDLEEPVKNYSSGMYVRLAFSILAAMNPDILILDEVLSVGDYRFRNKAFNRIQELSKQGCSIILVTHNMNEVSRFCDRCIWLHEGKVQANAEPSQVIREYLEYSRMDNDSKFTPQRLSYKLAQDNPSQGAAHIQSISILRKDASPFAEDKMTTADPFLIRSTIIKKQAGRVVLTLLLFDIDNNLLFSTCSSFDEQSNAENINLSSHSGSIQSDCYFPAPLLNRGTYIVNATLHITETDELLQFQQLLCFHISPNATDVDQGHFFAEGFFRPKLEWKEKAIHA